MEHVDGDRLTLGALGVVDLESVEADHVRSCPECATGLARLRRTVVVARGNDASPAPMIEPPARVWAAVVGELELPVRAEPRPGSPLTRRIGLIAAAALLAVASAGVGALVAGGDDAGTTAVGSTTAPPQQDPSVLASADLLPLDADIAGSARWLDGTQGTVLEVEVSGAAVPSAYLEVWLLDPASLRMVSLGALRDGVPAELTVPDGIDVGDYPTVDVSAEPLDDDPTHSGVSVARGDLRPGG